LAFLVKNAKIRIFLSARLLETLTQKVNKKINTEEKFCEIAEIHILKDFLPLPGKDLVLIS
jgi:hypothetical protein